MNTSTPEMTGVSGLADVEALARLANQMFKALPVAESFPAIAQSGTAFPMPSALGGVGVELPSNPLPGLPPVGSSIPGEDKLRALLAPLLSPSTQVLPPVAAQAEPSYYFLRQEGSGSFENGLNSAPFDVHAVRRDFPILNETVNGRPLIWLDNAATTQKPKPVIDRLVHFYSHENSNIHRAAHDLAARATDAYESGRETVRRFLNAASSEEIVFVRGATEAINLVAQSWGRKNIGEGDEIVITWLEHHANIVPWQQLCAETGARLHIVPVDDSGQIRLDEYERILGPRTKLVSLTQVSNALGTVTPAQEMTALAKRQGAHVLIDGAQSVSHMPVDVQALGCDWFVFSGHKIIGPTGIGALYGRLDILNAMPPWQGGGNMIRDVTFEKTQYQTAPARFEAGTGNIADVAGLAAALDYVDAIGRPNIARYEHDLLAHATKLLSDIPGLRIVGTAKDKAGVLSFNLDGIPSEEVGRALNGEGIAVRSGHHCAQPILRRFGLESSVRPSFAFYNTHAEIDALAAAVRRIRSGAPLAIQAPSIG